MLFETGQQIESLQAIDSELSEKVVIRRQLLARHAKMVGGKLQYFIGGFLQGGHELLSCHISGGSLICAAHPHRIQGRYGKAPVLSTNFRKPASTAGRVKSSQNRSISRRSSSRGIGLIK